MTTNIKVKLDNELKKAVNQRLEALGMSFNTFVVMASKQLVAQNKIPFTSEMPNFYQPTAETLAAMKHAYQAMNGEIPDNSPSFTNAKDLLDYLDRNDK